MGWCEHLTKVHIVVLGSPGKKNREKSTPAYRGVLEKPVGEGSDGSISGTTNPKSADQILSISLSVFFTCLF